MKTKLFYLILFLSISSWSQSTFPYQVELTPITIPNLPGFHSFASAQHNGKWLIIGGRLDGLHARQPFNAFPDSSNNTNIYVIDIASMQFYTSSVNVLATGLKEQLQSTNMNFYQDNDTLYIIGGYGFSASSNNHITYPYLTSIDVPNLINAIVSNSSITPYFKQITDNTFANTGGYLGKINNTFYLIGGHRFDGRYNPMGNPTFTQTYADKIQKFTIDNSGTQLSFSNYQSIQDAVHLRRRDYNLMAQVFPDGELGYTISSGVFQVNVDLPFLYPVDVKEGGYYPQTQFNQLLNNYHSAKISLYEQTDNRMHNLFFGGMSQYYYNNGNLVQDDLVPFVKTISRVTRFSDGTLSEYNLPIEMPVLRGASSELIVNMALPHYSNKVIKLSDIIEDEFVLGHIIGGIDSSSLNPFSNNTTSTTLATPTIYEVKLIKDTTLSENEVVFKQPNFSFSVHPNPVTDNNIVLKYNLPYQANLDYFITNIEGKVIDDGSILNSVEGDNTMNFKIINTNSKILFITLIFDDKFYSTQKIINNK